MDDDRFSPRKPTITIIPAKASPFLAGVLLLTKAFEIAAQCKAPRYSHRPRLSSAALHVSLNLNSRQWLIWRAKEELQPNICATSNAKNLGSLGCAVRLGGHERQLHPGALTALTDFGFTKSVAAFQVRSPTISM